MELVETLFALATLATLGATFATARTVRRSLRADDLQVARTIVVQMDGDRFEVTGTSVDELENSIEKQVHRRLVEHEAAIPSDS